MLQAIFDVFHTRGEWPTFVEIDRQLDRLTSDDFDLVEELPALRPEYLRHDSMGVPRAGERLRLTVAGLRQCTGAEHELELFLRALRWMVEQERDYDPPVKEPDEPTVTSGEAAEALNLSPDTRERDLAILPAILHEEDLLWSSAGSGEWGWTFTLPRRLRAFRRVHSVDEYLSTTARLLAPRTTTATVSISGEPQEPIMTEYAPSDPSPLPAPDRRKVFVIHGRDSEARQALFSFLRDLDLHPLEWEELVAATGSASPFTGEVVARAFTEAQAVVVLFTPDDEARLHPSLHGPNEPQHETELTGQARPNVLLEAGMALGANPDRTILVELGHLRPVSDLAGRNVVRLGATAAPLNALIHRLEAAGCRVNRANPAWMEPDRFAKLTARSRQAAADPPTSGALPRGQVLPATAPTPTPPNLTARLHDRGGSNHLLEVVNRGGVTMKDVHWELPSCFGVMRRGRVR